MASTSINRTNSSASGTTWTVSCWVKQCQPTADGGIFQFYQNGSNVISLYSNPIVKFRAFISDGYSAGDLTLNVSKRDPNAWSHYVAVCDTTNSTAADRWRLYINGDRVDDDSSLVASKTNPSSSYSFSPAVSGEFNLGAYFSNFSYHNYAHVHYCDGYAYAASNFGSTDSTTGEWKPNTAPSVTYGTNGFFLKFEDRTSLLTDSSGNNQTMSLSGSGTVTQTIDNPSNNFATWNTSDRWLGNTAGGEDFLRNGNTYFRTTSNSQKALVRSTIGVTSGKYYCEMKVTQIERTWVGICNKQIFTSSSEWWTQSNNNGLYWYGNGTAMYDAQNNSGNAYGGFVNNDIVMIALDMDNKALYFGKNGTWQNSGNPESGATKTGSVTEYSTLTNASYALENYGEVYFMAGEPSTAGVGQVQANFGNGYFGTSAISSAGTNASGIGIFEYDVPAGYTALSTKGLNL
tara:strand:+ start:30 stop:1409 length:1380 start_codon:yes stop_codon:yes gene_type:complete